MTAENIILESLDQPLEFKRTEGTLPVYVADEWEFFVNSQKQVVRFIRGNVYGKRTTIVAFGRKVGKSVVKKYDGISNMRQYFATIFAIFDAALADPAPKMKNKTDGFVVLIPEKTWSKFGQRFSRIFKLKFQTTFSYAVNYSQSKEEGQDAFYFWKRGRSFASVFNNIKPEVEIESSEGEGEIFLDVINSKLSPSGKSIKTVKVAKPTPYEPLNAHPTLDAIHQDEIIQYTDVDGADTGALDTEDFSYLDPKENEDRILSMLVGKSSTELQEMKEMEASTLSKLTSELKKKLDFFFYMNRVYYSALEKQHAVGTFVNPLGFFSKEEEKIIEELFTNCDLSKIELNAYSNEFNFFTDTDYDLSKIDLDAYDTIQRVIYKEKGFPCIVLDNSDYFYFQEKNKFEEPEIIPEIPLATLYEYSDRFVASVKPRPTDMSNVGYYNQSQLFSLSLGKNIDEIAIIFDKQSEIAKISSIFDPKKYSRVVIDFIETKYSKDKIDDFIFLARTVRKDSSPICVQTNPHDYAQSFIDGWFQTAGSESQAMAHRTLYDFEINSDIPKFWNYVDDPDHNNVSKFIHFSADVAEKRKDFIQKSLRPIYDFTQKYIQDYSESPEYMTLYRGVNVSTDENGHIKYYTPGTLECWSSLYSSAANFSSRVLMAKIPLKYIFLVNEMMLEKRDHHDFMTSILENYKYEKEWIVMGGAFATVPLYNFDEDENDAKQVSIVTEWILNEEDSKKDDAIKIITPADKDFKKYFDQAAKGNSLEELLGTKKPAVYKD